MNKQKLISVLQSRIAKRRALINYNWFVYAQQENSEWSVSKDKKIVAKLDAIFTGIEQKEDKQILKQLVEDERSIKEWKARFWKTLGMYCKEGV